MTLIKIILIVVGLAFTIFGYLIYFKEKYNLINDFDKNYRYGRKTKSYAKKVGFIEFIIGIFFVIVGICLIISK